MFQSLYIGLGPDFTSDLIEVETSDHARLQILLSYNWNFQIDRTNQADSEKIFAIKDFIGNLCSVMAAKIRSTVASKSFDEFHKGFARIIRSSIFGVDENGKIRDEYFIEKNNMIITNVDIQSVAPIDKKTRDSLKNTVSLAIEITTKNQEESANRLAVKLKQESEGELVKSQININYKAEETKMKLLSLEAESKSILDSGKANAEAKAMAEANNLKAMAKVQLSQLEAESKDMVSTANITREQSVYDVKMQHMKEMEQ